MYYKKSNWLMNLLLLCLITTLLVACGGDSGEAEAPAESEPVEQAAENEAVPDTQEEETTEEAATEVEAGEATEEAEVTEQPIEVREAATVSQAAQVIDLRKVTVPDDAEMMGQAKVGEVSFQASLGIEEAAELYRSELTEMGWQENIELSHLDKASASLYFTKDDFVLGFSASDMGGETMVSLYNHGNLDLRTLPQMADAEVGYAFPNTIGYFSPSDVATVVDFTKQGLAAQGWKLYTRPHTATSDNPDSQQLAFINNGLELSAFISVAPAQDNKTSVQYSITLLPLDLPIYEEASALEYDSFEPYLSYHTSADIDTLTSFYRDRLLGSGWVEMPDTATITAEQAGVFFANEAEQLALMLEILPDDGQNVATLRQFEVDEIFAQQDEEADSDTITAEAGNDLNSDLTESESQETSGSDSGPIPDLPIAVDAQDVVFDEFFEEITYSSPSDIETLADFYRETLSAQGWEEDDSFSMVDEFFATMDFTLNDMTLTVDMFNSGDDSPTDVTLSGSAVLGADSGSGEVASGGDSGPLTLVEEEDNLLPSDNTGYTSEGSEFSHITTTWSPSDVATLAELYQTGLVEQGWSSVSSEVADKANLLFTQDGQELSLNIAVVDGESEITLVFRDPVAAEAAGILPPAGKARLYLINFEEFAVMGAVDGQELEVAGGGLEIEDPVDAPTLDVTPGSHDFTTTLPDGTSITDPVEVGEGEVWMLWIDTEGALPLRLY